MLNVDCMATGGSEGGRIDRIQTHGAATSEKKLDSFRNQPAAVAHCTSGVIRSMDSSSTYLRLMSLFTRWRS